MADRRRDDPEGAFPVVCSMGDPAGVGPEIIAEAWRRRDEARFGPFYLCAPATAFARSDLCPTTTIAHAGEAAAVFDSALPVLDIGNEHDAIAIGSGLADREGARAALASLDRALDETVARRAGALVTGPVSKSALYAIGFRHAGQTGHVAEKAGMAPEAGVMMLAGPALRVVPITVHVPLREVPTLLTQQLIETTARTVALALERDFGVVSPVIAVAGLNPHAGEDGALGREEIETIAPAVAALASEGLRIEGPLPADTLFHEAARARYNAILCPTHDQALIPVKTLHFDEAVNITLGLPIVRASPDHGTAFAIAGRGEANARSMIAAIEMACGVARRRREHDSAARG